MRTKILRSVCLLLACCLLLSGCGVAGNEAAERPVEETLPEAEIQSIACLYAYAGHVCVMLDCADRITAVVEGLKRDRLMYEKIQGLENMPSPYTSGSINIEELVAIGPDLILLRQENLEDPGELEKLDKCGIPYVVVDYVTMADQIQSIRTVGRALGRTDRAGAYIQYYEDTIQMVKDRLADLPDSEKKRVFHSVNEVVRTDIRDTLSYEVLAAAGCINVIDDTGDTMMDGAKAYATVEQIYAWDPDVVLVNEPSAAEYFRTDSKFTGLRAVREGEVYQLPVGISRWAHPGSIESPLAVLYVAALLYPAYFEDIDMNREIADFYARYFNIQLTDEDITQILSGQGMRSPRQGQAK